MPALNGILPVQRWFLFLAASCGPKIQVVPSSSPFISKNQAAVSTLVGFYPLLSMLNAWRKVGEFHRKFVTSRSCEAGIGIQWKKDIPLNHLFWWFKFKSFILSQWCKITLYTKPAFFVYTYSFLASGLGFTKFNLGWSQFTSFTRLYTRFLKDQTQELDMQSGAPKIAKLVKNSND
jgi:hypothetical protein